MKFPKHAAGLTLNHNEHKNVYETVQEFTEVEDPIGEWISEEQKKKAYETQELWEIQWYPDSPVGFICLWACDLDELLKAAIGEEK